MTPQLLSPLAAGIAFTCASLSPSAASQPACLFWASVAEQHYQMPRGLMSALVTLESKANPNALNVDGKALYFSSAVEAAAAIKELTPRSFEVDVGCGQLTVRWHGPRFTSIGAMLDPRTNLSYASWHLSELREKYGSWSAAVARYHSFQPDRGRRYACRIRQIMHANGGNTSALENTCS